MSDERDGPPLNMYGTHPQLMLEMLQEKIILHFLDARDYYNNAFIGTIVGILVNAYFWTVVFRAFKYMRNVVEGRCENRDEGPIDIGEDANSSSYLKEKLTTIIKRVIYISKRNINVVINKGVTGQ
jgi:hypothetical protein